MLKKLVRRNQIHLGELSVEDVATLMLNEAAKYFLFAAAGLNRTSLKKAVREPEAAIVEKGLQQAFSIKRRLPVKAAFDEVVARAETVRRGDLGRKARGGIEALFRKRLAAEHIPVLMAPPIRAVPGILVSRRKPDGVWPDPSAGQPPVVYLEIKNLRRVADDIQKRLYEVAEASVEMKFLYGNLDLRGLGLPSTEHVLEGTDAIRKQIRAAITGVRPAVVALFLCSRVEAEKYRAGAEAFIDRLFFQEEIEDCLAYLRDVTSTPSPGASPPRERGRNRRS
ncbi:MAG TPA: hypothetical protein VFK02_06920 [Kofleriaceae bacterium]|nr:hypothetical protein [Kofleriaceae bacterium]